jgi:hypothetical protein
VDWLVEVNVSQKNIITVTAAKTSNLTDCYNVSESATQNFPYKNLRPYCWLGPRDMPKKKVKAFFKILGPELQKIHSYPTKIFNTGENGLTIVQHKITKVISVKGTKQVSKLSATDRGSLITW